MTTLATYRIKYAIVWKHGKPLAGCSHAWADIHALNVPKLYPTREIAQNAIRLWLHNDPSLYFVVEVPCA